MLLFLLACSGQAPSEAEGAPLNLLVVSLDTVRWDHTGLGGYERDTTPVMDALARQPGALDFSAAFTAASWSQPAYASLFTGLDALDHGVGFTRFSLDPQRSTLASALSAYGYHTGAFCSGPHLDPVTGLDQGFQTYEHQVDNHSLGDAVEPALAWIAEQEEPFFAFVHGYDAHAPYPAPSSFSEIFDPEPEDFRHTACSEDGSRTCSVGAPFSLPDHMGRMTGWVSFSHEHDMASAKVFGREEVALSRPGRALLGQLTETLEGDPGQLRTEADLRRSCALDEANWAIAIAEVERVMGPYLERTEEGLALSAELRPRVEHKRGSPDLLGEYPLAHAVAHYDASVLAADLQLGRLLAGLEAQGHLADTLVVVLSDHGEALGEQGVFGHEDQWGQGVFHVPLVIRIPSDRSPERVDALVSLAGLTPTLLRYLGMVPPAGSDGRDFSPLLRGEPVAEPAPVLSASRCCYTVWTPEWELMGRLALDPVVWQLHAWEGGEDLAASHPELVEELAAELSGWPRSLPSVNELWDGQLEDRGDLKEALRDGGYWAPPDETPGPEGPETP